MPTKIPWTDETWSVVTGCTPVSEGCRNCYAARMAATRLRYHPRYEDLATIKNGKARWTGKINLNHDVLEQPLHWRKPRMVFIASMGDLFHKDVPDAYIDQVFCVIAHVGQHRFQLLTKRPKRMATYIAGAFDRISALLYNSSYGQRIDLYRYGTFWGDRDRFPGADMETKEASRARGSSRGWLSDGGAHQPVPPSPSRILSTPGVSPYSTDDQRETNCHGSASGSVGLFQQANPRRSNDQPQERYQGRQSPRKSRVDDIQRATPTCPGSPGSETPSPNRIKASEDSFNRERRDQNSRVTRIWNDGQGHRGRIPDEAQGYLSNLLPTDVETYLAWPLSNAWLGVSVENQAAADERIPILKQIPAAVRFVSFEPLLSKITVGNNIKGSTHDRWLGISWAIVGGESGPSARPMHPDWARSLRNQCKAAGIPYFFKQWGEWLPLSQRTDQQRVIQARETKVHLVLDGESIQYEYCYRIGRKRAGRLLDGRVWDEFPVSK